MPDRRDGHSKLAWDKEAGSFVTVDPHPRIDTDQIKEDRLLDIIRRVIANSENAKEVAHEIAKDWFPVWRVDPDGKFNIARPRT